NQGKPPIAATAKPGDFRSGVVPAKQAGGAYKAPPPDARRNGGRPGGASPENGARPGNENRPGNNAEARHNTYNHATDLQPHSYSPPNTGNAGNDRKLQQQQDKLAARQAQEHQKLQQQQEKEHQRASQRNYNDEQKQQMEQRHAQQTQQLEQRHEAQQQQVQQRAAPRQSPPPREERPPH
ncbi:MAG: hypothetical protein JOY93_08680, partial [Acidobacteriales bacterium]|nr:hypothetical protein [Terriglobales bacterium]